MDSSILRHFSVDHPAHTRARGRRHGPFTTRLRSVATLVFAVLLASHCASIFAANPLVTGGVLIATPNLDGTSFERTVILITHYGPDGAMGIALNRDSGANINQYFSDVPSAPLFLGGPVRPDALLILVHKPGTAVGSPVGEDVFFAAGATAFTFLKNTLSEERSAPWRAFAGYSGWSAGQLDEEVRRGDWETLTTGAHYAFHADLGSIWTLLLQLARARWI